MERDIDDLLQDMRSAGKVQDMKGKGTFGEEAVLNIVHNYCMKRGGFIEHGFMYPYATTRDGLTYLGNVFLRDDGQYFHQSRRVNDEIDILYVSPFKVFAIEVKSYHADMVLKNDCLLQNGSIRFGDHSGITCHKNPIWQTEKHARHLYHQIYDVLPEGNPKYIQPMLVFCDRCTFADKRETVDKLYIPAAILNNFKETLMEFDVPLDYKLDLEAIKQKLNDIRRG